MTDPHQHFSQLLELLKIERQEDRDQYETKIRNKSIDQAQVRWGYLLSTTFQKF